MYRDDLSNKLIHLTSDKEAQSGEEIFYEILDSGKLIGSSKTIRGGFKCICFSEAPISKLGLLLSRENSIRTKYSPFGVMIDKKYMFSLGARPVIYQPNNEFVQLNNDNQYRHVIFDPNNGIDWTWEREWRYKADELSLDPSVVTLIVPTRDIVENIKESHNSGNQLYATLGDAGQSGITSLPWHFIVLEDLGVKM
ncbi:MAG: hypothetical protein O9340_10485 [Cyclobacteriaceae bacterium]|jgi:hypothetical protein|nr:hypothetical protein [Cyclobacteriaceae bacterium]